MEDFNDEDYMYNVVMPDLEDEDDEIEEYYRNRGSFRAYRYSSGGGCCLVALLPILIFVFFLVVLIM